MKKWFPVVSTLLLASPAPAVAAEPYAHSEEAIVKVECMGGWGTAVKVGVDTYISVNHVTSNSGCKVKGVPIKVTSVDSQDFSTFIGPESPYTIRISCDGYRDKEVYVARGYGGQGTQNLLFPWLATAVRIPSVLGPYHQFTLFIGDVLPGMSGGPVIDRQGRVTGVVNIGNPTGSVDLSQTRVCKGS